MLLAISAFVLLWLAGACSRTDERIELNQPIDETRLLIDYLDLHGNLVNHPDIPTMISPEEVYEHLNGYNRLVIDVRTPVEYAEGHIAHSVNVLPGDILHYFDHVIDPNAFEKIILVCNDAMLSGYVAAVLQFLGHPNVVFMRNGLSSWDMEIAERYWLAAMSSHMEGKLETTPHQKNLPGAYPVIQTGLSDTYDMLRARAAEILLVNEESTVTQAQQVLDSPADFYIINYWPQALYDQGHIPGSIQYDPKASFGKSQYLNTLPTDKPIVLYCYTAHHSVYPIAYLRLLGYEAYHIPYGVNAFIQQTMLDTQPPRRSFVPDMVKKYPLIGSGIQAIPLEDPSAIKTESLVIQGGC